MDVFAAMRESLALLRTQRFQEVVDRCVPVLDIHATYVPLRLLVAQALASLGRSGEAESHLRYCLDLDPECGPAYRHLAELELGRDRPKSAARLLDEACRIAPGDREAKELLARVERQLQSAAGAPIPSPATPPRPPPREPEPAPRRRRHTSAPERSRSARANLARGTDSPDVPRRPATLRDGFGDYLAEIGVLSRAQVRAALIYRRTRGVPLGAAAVALGFVSAPKLRWAERAYQSRAGE